MATSSPRCLRSSKRRCLMQETDAISDIPVTKRPRTPFEVFFDQELKSLVDQRQPTISKETAHTIYECLIKRWQSMSKEELQLYEDIVMVSKLDSNYGNANDESSLPRK